MKRFLTVLLVLWATPLSGAQQVSEPHFGETLEVRIINVDVVALDEAGNPVHGLTSGEFVIYEDGDPQPITNFAEYRADLPPRAAQVEKAVPDEPAADMPVAIRPPEKRYLLFFIDSLNLREKVNREAFFRGLRAFLEQSMRDGDEAAIFYWETSLRTLVAMTPNRSAIIEAIAKIEEESRLRIDQTDIELAELEMRKRMWEADREVDGDQQQAMDARLAARRAFDLQQRKVNAINYAIQSAAGLDGRKIMILATDRLTKLPGLEYGHGYSLGDRELNARKQMDSVVRNANAAGVTVYGFFPKGLVNDLPSAASRENNEIEVAGIPMVQATRSYYELMNQAEPVDSIATRTGGMSALGGRLSELALADTAQQLDNYYSLAYRAPDNRTDSTRRIRVEVTRPGVTVRTRSAVVDRSENEIVRDRAVSAVLFGRAHSAIDIRATHGVVRKSGMAKLIVPVEISIPIAQLTTLPGSNGYDGKFRVLAVAATEDGDVSEVAEKEQAFHIPAKELSKAHPGTFTYRLDVEVRDTSHRIVIAVVDELDRDTGYAGITLDLERTESARKANRIPDGPIDTRVRPWKN